MPLQLPARRVLLLVALLGGCVFRIAALDTYGFSEDETAKLRAVEEYRHGRFSANAEHPMLMKLAIWGSSSLADAARPYGVDVAPETTLRLPNAMAGTATIAFVAGVTHLLFGAWPAVVAALLVAFDPNVIAINRIGKEDSFLLCFFFLAVWCYERAKTLGRDDVVRARRWYTASGAVFGLMLASKYMPHLLGLYALFNVLAERHPGNNRPDKRLYYAAMAGTFLAANFAVLLPDTWSYIASYLSGARQPHHGFHYAGQLYATDVPLSANGVPTTYYLTLMATKMPVAVLVAAVGGLIALARRSPSRGSIWMHVLLAFLLVGYSLAAAKFQRYALPILMLTDILAAVGVVWFGAMLAAGARQPVLRPVAAVVGALGVVIASATATVSAAPFYSLYQNVAGARLARPATIFPEEAYDYGVREAVEEIAWTASPGAVVVSDVPGVVSHYLDARGRGDLEVLTLSQQGLAGSREQWILVQDGHLYFENAAAVHQLRRQRSWREYRLLDTPVLEVYRLSM